MSYCINIYDYNPMSMLPPAHEWYSPPVPRFGTSIGTVFTLRLGLGRDGYEDQHAHGGKMVLGSCDFGFGTKAAVMAEAKGWCC